MGLGRGFRKEMKTLIRFKKHVLEKNLMAFSINPAPERSLRWIKRA
jgi:hypothetical protein